MTLAIVIIDGHGLSNEAPYELLPKLKVIQCWPFISPYVDSIFSVKPAVDY